MIELKADLWQIPCDVRVISTNGSTNRFGHAVLGRGCALEAKQKYPGLARDLGELLTYPDGNHVYWFDAITLATFPVKHRWMERANIRLIQQSAHELVALTDVHGWQRVAMPRVGCGNGKLSWGMVQSVLRPILDDRFLVCSYVHEG